MPYYVYILASRARGTLYIGVTNDLVRRVYEHRRCDRRIYLALWRAYARLLRNVSDVRDAIQREKRLKRWRRAWKIELIEKDNKDWHDLWPGIAQL